MLLLYHLYMTWHYFTLLIAALHFNENFGGKQAKTAAGIEKLRTCFSKFKQGELTLSQFQFPRPTVSHN